MHAACVGCVQLEKSQNMWISFPFTMLFSKNVATHTLVPAMCEWQMGFMWWWLMCVWHMDESQNFRWMKCAIYHHMRHIRSRSFILVFFSLRHEYNFSFHCQAALCLCRKFLAFCACMHINMLKVKYFSNSMHKHSKICYNLKVQQRMITGKEHAYVYSYFCHSITLPKYKECFKILQ